VQLKANICCGIKYSFRENLEIEGRRVILPSLFSRSPRAMLQLYQDSMASVRQFGKPLLFITITSNPCWPEVTAAVKPGQSPSVQANLITQIFQMKLESLLNNVVKNHRLGTVASDGFRG
jgi:hypothetical protein